MWNVALWVLWMWPATFQCQFSHSLYDDTAMVGDWVSISHAAFPGQVRGAFRDSELCQPGLDSWQIHMSRMGLVAQAALQLVTALFLVADVVSDYTHKLVNLQYGSFVSMILWLAW